MEHALLHLALAAVGAGATAPELVARLEQVGLRLTRGRATELLCALAYRDLVWKSSGRADRARFEPTDRGVARTSALETRLQVEAELADLERLRTQLLGVVGHELRTPLTAIRTAAGLLQDSRLQPNPEETRRLLSNIARSAERMQRLVSDVLDIARFRAGEVRLQLRAFDAAGLAERAVAAMSPVTLQKRQHLRLDATTRPLVYGDRQRLEQVLLKLLSNANRFAPPGAEIRLRVETSGNDVLWSVVDRGPGISAEDLPRLFERFFAADHPAPEQAAGPGLGLAISLAVARAHGGTIEVESSPGSGSTFRLRIPIDRDGSRSP